MKMLFYSKNLDLGAKNHQSFVSDFLIRNLYVLYFIVKYCV